jgi:hypothetical protein
MTAPAPKIPVGNEIEKRKNLAGLFFSGDVPVGRKLGLLRAFDRLSTVLIYGAIVDASTLFISALTTETILSTYLVGVSFNAIHGIPTIIVLAVLARRV